MKKKLTTYLSVIAAVFMLIASVSSVWASSDIFDEYGRLTEPRSGSVSASVQVPLGEGKTLPVVGMEFSVYQIWTLTEEAEVIFNAPFDGVANEDARSLADLEGETPASTARTLTEQYAKIAEGAEEFTGYSGEAKLNENGSFEITDLPFGGYLFISKGAVDGPTTIGDSRETVTSRLSVDPFLVTVPIKQGEDENGQGIYSREVNASPKPHPEITTDKENPPDVPIEKEVKIASEDDSTYGDYKKLNARNEVVTYRITTKMPTNASSFKVMDTLEDFLEFVPGDETALKSVSLSGMVCDLDSFRNAGGTVSVEGQKLTVTFPESGELGVTAKDNADKTIQITFNAKIRADVTDEQIIEKYGENRIPNEACYQIDNEAEVHSNVVHITPPSPEFTTTPTPTPTTPTPTPTTTVTPVPSKMPTPTTTTTTTSKTTTTNSTTRTVKTGDTNATELWILLLCAASVALIGVTIARRRRKDS